MAYMKILAPLTGSASDAMVLAGAFAAAAPFKAHVLALFVRPDPAEAMPFFGEGVSGAMAQEIVDTAKVAADKAANDARTALAIAAKDAGAIVIDRPEKRDTVSISFREVQGNFADRVTLAGRLSDLVVFGPLKQSDRPGIAEAFEATLLDTGRPVVLTGQTAPKNFARRIAIGWDGSGACARALIAAMPYLARAETIFITKSDGTTAALRERIARLNSAAAIIECVHHPLYLEDVFTGERRDLDFLAGKKVASLSGIAQPESFEQSLVKLGGELVYSKRFADHHRFSQQEILNAINRGKKRQAEVIITTQKDAVRFPKIDRRDLPFYFMRVEIQIVSGANDFQDCVRKICFR